MLGCDLLPLRFGRSVLPGQGHLHVLLERPVCPSGRVVVFNLVQSEEAVGTEEVGGVTREPSQGATGVEVADEYEDECPDQSAGLVFRCLTVELSGLPEGLEIFDDWLQEVVHLLDAGPFRAGDDADEADVFRPEAKVGWNVEADHVDASDRPFLACCSIVEGVEPVDGEGAYKTKLVLGCIFEALPIWPFDFVDL